MRSRAEATPSFVWVESLGDPGSTIALPRDESHYVARVCRARAGDAISLTDGRGGLATARVVKPAPPVVVEILEVQAAPARGGTSWLLCGAPEGRCDDWLVEKLAELGVAVFQPIDTARARWRPERTRADRWLRLARAALGQSRGAWMMEIRPPVAWDDFVTSTPPGASAWFADPEGERAGRPPDPSACG